jgi:glycyl-tRNA synthetase beta chain
LQDADGTLRAGFVAVANTDRDPGSHIRRGNEWVIGGRLEDARFFWGEDRKRELAERAPELSGVVFHAKVGTYAEKAARVAAIADKLAGEVGLDDGGVSASREAARLAKVDLVTGTVGEFPELQGKTGGLMLEAEGKPEALWRAVYEHYQPAGANDAPPDSVTGAVVSVADKLDTIASMCAAGQAPTGSRDPFGLRRACVGLFRVAIARSWPVSLQSLAKLVDGESAELVQFLGGRFRKLMLDSGYSPNEINAVLRPNVSPTGSFSWPLVDVVRRLEAIQTVRAREDFVQLVDLTKRVDNILTKGEEQFSKAAETAGGYADYEEESTAAKSLDELVAQQTPLMAGLEQQQRYREAVDLLAKFVDPVEKFFDEVLVLDDSQPKAMLSRQHLLAGLRGVLTRCFDIRELAGQAERS